MAKFSKTNFVENFNIITEKFNEDFIREQLSNVKKNERIFICGPPILNKSVQSILLKINPYY